MAQYHQGFAVGGFALLTLLFTWPIITQFNTALLGSYATDNFEILWKMWWVPHALQEGLSPFFSDKLYYPFGYDLSWGELTPLHSFYLMPLTVWIGEEFTYNSAIVASYILTGWLTYLLARRWLRGLVEADAEPLKLFALAFYAGALFAFCVYRIQHIAGGHLNLAHTQWIVLALLALDRWLDDQRLADAAWIGLAISLAALSTWYYAFVLIPLLPVYIIGRRVNLLSLLTKRQTWLSVLVIAVIITILCGPFLLPYLRAASEGQTGVPLEQAVFWAASPLDYVMPNPGHPLWQQPVQGIMWPLPDYEMPIEFMISIGWVTLVLGLWGWRVTRGSQWRALKWLVAAAFLLSLGPSLNLGRLSLGIPLPAMLLRELPIGSSIRSWGRFALFVMLGLSVMSAAAWSIIARRVAPSVFYGLLGVTLALILFAAWDGPAGLISITPRPVDLWLAAQEGGGAVMQYPVEAALTGGAMYATRYFDQPVTYGTGTFFGFLYRDRHPELLTFPQDSALDQLAVWEVRYVLVDVETVESGSSFTMAEVNSQPRLQYIDTFGNQAVYELIN